MATCKNSWRTDLAGSMGWHYAVGIAGRNEEGVMMGIEWIQHFFGVNIMLKPC